MQLLSCGYTKRAGKQMATYRERREAKAERLAEWAEKREAKASALELANEPYRDWALITQPGHIPERARMNHRSEKAFENSQKAKQMSQRAAGIQSQLDKAIYDDDPDAIERLRERIAALEAQKEERKAANAAYRKAHPEIKQLSPYARSVVVPFPSYALTNLSGNINRLKKRLEKLEADA